ncbi:hypothetical protein MAPG_10845 [Magnaporthiopsis poae ATCC 64411]|uniref:Uncharacterized protein n=1 Tax=Magnaporthiopsis poae (strain ATCC 64411 / 73-15) TaxID=644358 RepID=A0A0C4EDN9_MAGP6|nr:hypothetical protein MAPG_10845 [Magnaporthiopsis poae ATCC 64411]
MAHCGLYPAQWEERLRTKFDRPEAKGCRLWEDSNFETLRENGDVVDVEWRDPALLTPRYTPISLTRICCQQLLSRGILPPVNEALSQARRVLGGDESSTLKTSRGCRCELDGASPGGNWSYCGATEGPPLVLELPRPGSRVPTQPPLAATTLQQSSISGGSPCAGSHPSSVEYQPLMTDGGGELVPIAAEYQVIPWTSHDNKTGQLTARLGLFYLCLMAGYGHRPVATD